MNITPHEADLLTLLRLCGPHDEVRIIVEEGNWIVLVENKKRVVIDTRGLAKKAE